MKNVKAFENFENKINESHTSNYSKTTFIGNADLSGDVTIINKKTNKQIEVDGDDLLEFVLEYVRGEKIAILQEEDYDSDRISRIENGEEDYYV